MDKRSQLTVSKPQIKQADSRFPVDLPAVFYRMQIALIPNVKKFSEAIDKCNPMWYNSTVNR